MSDKTVTKAKEERVRELQATQARAFGRLREIIAEKRAQKDADADEVGPHWSPPTFGRPNEQSARISGWLDGLDWVLRQAAILDAPGDVRFETKVYTSIDFDGHWPVPVAAVVVAHNEHDAAVFLMTALAAAGLPTGGSTLQRVDLTKHGATLLSDGNY